MHELKIYRELCVMTMKNDETFEEKLTCQLTKPSNCSDKIKMPKSSTGCRIKSIIPVENMNIEKLRDI